MRKTRFLVFLLSLLWSSGFAQTTSPEVIGAGGSYDTSADAQLSWTLGEIVTESVADGNTQLTQGFQQVTLTITAVEESGLALTLKAFPNPVADKLQVDMTSSGQLINFQLIDATGKALQQGKLSSEQNSIDFSSYAVGSYLLVLTDASTHQAQTFKIIKNN